MTLAPPAAYVHRFVEVHGIAAERLQHPDQLAVAVVAAAGAMGLSAEGAPVVRAARHGGHTVAHLCHEGHIVLRTAPDAGRCVIDLLAEQGTQLQRGLEVMARRLGVVIEVAGRR